MTHQIKRPAHMALAQLLQPWADECCDCMLGNDCAAQGDLVSKMNRVIVEDLQVVCGWLIYPML